MQEESQAGRRGGRWALKSAMSYLSSVVLQLNSPPAAHVHPPSLAPFPPANCSCPGRRPKPLTSSLSGEAADDLARQVRELIAAEWKVEDNVVTSIQKLLPSNARVMVRSSANCGVWPSHTALRFRSAIACDSPACADGLVSFRSCTFPRRSLLGGRGPGGNAACGTRIRDQLAPVVAGKRTCWHSCKHRVREAWCRGLRCGGANECASRGPPKGQRCRAV